MTRSFASRQPNIPGRGVLAGYSGRFWGLVVAIGVATGLAAAGFIALLNGIERLAWGRPASQFLAAVTAASPLRGLLALLAAGVIAGVGALLVRRLRGSGGGEISDALWLQGGRLELPASLVRGTLSIVTVGLGASLGREAAPQLSGAAFGSELCERSRAIPPAQRRLLVAAGAGAGMAAVYNVPLGGALFALEVLLGSPALPLALLGNGKELAQLAFVGKLSVGLLAVLFVLKPLVTAACLGSGAPGGLFTPTLVLGVLFGALLGHAWSVIWPGSPIGSYALIGGGAVLAAAMQGPLSATVLMLELT